MNRMSRTIVAGLLLCFAVSVPRALKLAFDVRRIGYSEDFWKKMYPGGEFSFK